MDFANLLLVKILLYPNLCLFYWKAWHPWQMSSTARSRMSRRSVTAAGSFVFCNPAAWAAKRDCETGVWGVCLESEQPPGKGSRQHAASGQGWITHLAWTSQTWDAFASYGCFAEVL